MKQGLAEFNEPEIEILSEDKFSEEGETSLRIRAKWQHASIINNNGRLYSEELLKREIEKIQPDLPKGKIYGCAYHPKNSAEVPDIAMIWRKVEMKNNGECIGEADIIPTNAGKAVMAILKSGGRLGISSRGYGTTTRKTEGGRTYNEVNNDFILKSPGDIVLDPSVPGAEIKKMIEQRMDSFEFTEEELEQRKRILEDKFYEARLSGFEGDLPDYKKLAEENEEEVEESEELHKRYNEAVYSGFTGSYQEFVKLIESKK